MIMNNKVYGEFKVTVVIGISLMFWIIAFEVQIGDGLY